MREQLTFNFTTPVKKFDLSDFIHHKGNHIAYSYIMKDDWNFPVTCLVGFEYTGKTSLLTLWSEKEKAFSISPKCLKEKNFIANNYPLIKSIYSAFSLDNLDSLISNQQLEENLFHLYNHCVQENKKLLITSSQKPSSLSFFLPDLSSRLKSVPTFLLDPPSTDEKEIFIIKYFSDFQLSPDMSIVKYINEKGPQGLKQLRKLIEDIYKTSMKQKKKLTIASLKKLLLTKNNEK